MMMRCFRLFLPGFLSAILSFAACTPFGQQIPTRSIEHLHFFPPGNRYCGPASLATVMDYWGVHVAQDELAQSVFLPNWGGAFSLTLLTTAEEHGLHGLLYKGTRNELISKIDQGFPLIVSLKQSGNDVIGHFVVVYGYGKRCVLYWDGATGKGICEPEEQFFENWSNAGNMILWIHR